ncbi:hypothetical protein ACCAA_350102 [Candidatus Accumulibacter aalborgensis]|uniref:Uncharacterized protein n=1 Tax=Candidatus Accumulibacter aalborgensis TaxID=1860102 RepID=A0A1A8XNI3_9PROT|nr:hypothetical protein ACCAA_350102 [Candidatus Accumulibacter aalborgensis]
MKQPLSAFILKNDADLFYLLCKRLFATSPVPACDLRLVKHGKT